MADGSAVGGFAFDAEGNAVWYDHDGVTNLGPVPEYDWSGFVESLPSFSITLNGVFGVLHDDGDLTAD